MLRLLRYLPFFVAAGVLNFLLVADGIRHGLPPRAPAPALDAATHPRVVILGADGIDYRWLLRYLDEDASRPPSERRLPHLGALRSAGAFQPLRSEIPPESPVAWASLLTGVNPARHGVFDFIRPSASYRPLNGMVSIRPMRLALGRVPVRPPLVNSRLSAPTFLERVRDAGYTVLGLRQPLAFPVRNLPGAHLLSGLGTPDASGGAGFYPVWSAAPGFPEGDTTFGGIQIPLDPEERSVHASHLPGPFDPTLARDARGRKQRAQVPIRFEVLAGREPAAVAIHLQGRTVVVERDAGTVEADARSPFLPVTFTLGTWPPIRLKGHIRFEVKRIDPLVVLGDPVNIWAPEAPFPLTT
ncbi:MAG: alkaline phosphatase family protein, partial [Planctomycetota bacterium]